MNKPLRTFSLVALALVLSVAFSQVATVEVLGVDATSAHSPEEGAAMADDSVGEVVVRVRAVDAEGNPVEGATVSWRVENATTSPVWVVDASGTLPEGEEISAVEGEEATVDGGTTDANGEAFLTVDSATAGDTQVHVTVDGVEGATYSGGPMRVVWF